MILNETIVLCSLQQKLLGQIPTPLWSRHGYHKLSGEKLPAVRTHKEVVFGGASFLIGECKGEGAYGKVFKAMKSDNKDETIADMDVVVKVHRRWSISSFLFCFF